MSERGRKAGGFIIILAIGVLMMFFISNMFGLGIEDIFKKRATATVTIVPDCSAVVICDFNAKTTSVSFSKPVSIIEGGPLAVFGKPIAPLSFFRCVGPIGGIEIFEEFSVAEAGFTKETSAIRVCDQTIITTFTFPVELGQCYNWKLMVGEKDANTGLKRVFYTMTGQECV